MTPRLPQLREDVANVITFHPGNRTGTPEQRHPVSLMLADAVLRVVRPCSCDGDLIECSHEAARGQAEEENRRIRDEHDALKATVERVRRLQELTIATSCRVQAIHQAEDTLRILDTPASAPESPATAPTPPHPTREAHHTHGDGA